MSIGKTGFFVPSTYIDSGNITFGESLAHETTLEEIDAATVILREKTERKRAKEELFFGPQY